MKKIDVACVRERRAGVTGNHGAGWMKGTGPKPGDCDRAERYPVAGQGCQRVEANHPGHAGQHQVAWPNAIGHAAEEWLCQGVTDVVDEECQADLCVGQAQTYRQNSDQQGSAAVEDINKEMGKGDCSIITLTQEVRLCCCHVP